MLARSRTNPSHLSHKVDYSIDCMSDEHKLAEKYALVMVLFYPVGIPVMYVRSGRSVL